MKQGVRNADVRVSTICLQETIRTLRPLKWMNGSGNSSGQPLSLWRLVISELWRRHADTRPRGIALPLEAPLSQLLRDRSVYRSDMAGGNVTPLGPVPSPCWSRFTVRGHFRILSVLGCGSDWDALGGHIMVSDSELEGSFPLVHAGILHRSENATFPSCRLHVVRVRGSICILHLVEGVLLRSQEAGSSTAHHRRATRAASVAEAALSADGQC